MFTLEKSNDSYIETELIIMNSNPSFNLISTGKDLLSYEDVLIEHEESSNIEKERYLVKYKNDYIGILDFTMCNPNDSKPWLGLFVIHNQYHRTGIGFELYKLYEKIMIDRGVKEIRLGCLHENKLGMAFWLRQGYKVYKDIDYKGREMSCLSKKLLLSET